MPHKKQYNSKTVGKGGSRTLESVMGSEGQSAQIKPMVNKSKPTGSKSFDSMSSTKPAGKRQNH